MHKTAHQLNPPCTLQPIFFFSIISHLQTDFTITTKFHTFDQISHFRPSFIISTKFHTFDQISHFRPNFTLSTKFHTFDQISHFRSSFIISTKFHNSCWIDCTNLPTSCILLVLCNLQPSLYFTGGEILLERKYYWNKNLISTSLHPESISSRNKNKNQEKTLKRAGLSQIFSFQPVYL